MSRRFEAKLHQEGNNVTAADGYWLVAMGKSSPRVGSIRGRITRGLTIRSPKLGFGPFFAILAIRFEDKLHKERNDVAAADGNWLVAIGKAFARVGSIRVPLGRGLTIRSPEVGL